MPRVLIMQCVGSAFVDDERKMPASERACEEDEQKTTIQFEDETDFGEPPIVQRETFFANVES